MNREKERKHAAYARYCNDSSVTFSLQCNCFEEGARWADEHPSCELVTAVTKVCQAWMCGSLNDVRDRMNELGKLLNNGQ